tara:strand:+ start:8529 stop:8762 length:234 start_codon:yes stop_codon:yes gene_type:complete
MSEPSDVDDLREAIRVAARYLDRASAWANTPALAREEFARADAPLCEARSILDRLFSERYPDLYSYTPGPGYPYGES